MDDEDGADIVEPSQADIMAALFAGFVDDLRGELLDPFIRMGCLQMAGEESKNPADRARIAEGYMDICFRRAEAIEFMPDEMLRTRALEACPDILRKAKRGGS